MLNLWRLVSTSALSRLNGRRKTSIVAAASRGRVALALAVLALGACATPPEADRGEELTGYLPAGQTLYLGVRVPHAEALLDAVVTNAGVESRQLENLLGQTEQIVASYGRRGDGAPQMYFAGSGRYSPRRAGLFMRFSPRWSRERVEISGEDYRYWQDRETGLQVSFPNSSTLLAATEDIGAGLVPKDRAFDRFLAPPAVVEQFDVTDVSFFMPDPVQWLYDRIGVLPFELPILDLRVVMDRIEEQEGERGMVGDVRFASERDARAFTVVFRLMAATIAREVGVEQPDLLERLTIERREDTVRFSGIHLSDRRMGQMIGALFVGSVTELAAGAPSGPSME